MTADAGNQSGIGVVPTGGDSGIFESSPDGNVTTTGTPVGGAGSSEI